MARITLPSVNDILAILVTFLEGASKVVRLIKSLATFVGGVMVTFNVYLPS